MVEEDDADFVTFRQVARTLENKKREQEAQVSKLERELSVHQRAKPSTAEMWAKIAAGVLALDNDARMKARKLSYSTRSSVSTYSCEVSTPSRKTSSAFASRPGAASPWNSTSTG